MLSYLSIKRNDLGSCPSALLSFQSRLHEPLGWGLLHVYVKEPGWLQVFITLLEAFSFAWVISGRCISPLKGIPSGCPYSLSQKHRYRRKKALNSASTSLKGHLVTPVHPSPVIISSVPYPNLLLCCPFGRYRFDFSLLPHKTSDLNLYPIGNIKIFSPLSFLILVRQIRTHRVARCEGEEQAGICFVIREMPRSRSKP